MSQLERIKTKLTEYTKNGGDVNDLKKADKLYQYIKNAGIFDENGKKYTVEKKFEMAGFPRKPQRVQDVKSALIDDINNYLKETGDFYQVPSLLDFPFYERIKTYKRTINNTTASFDEIMKLLGFNFDRQKFNDAHSENFRKRKEQRLKEKAEKAKLKNNDKN